MLSYNEAKEAGSAPGDGRLSGRKPQGPSIENHSEGVKSFRVGSLNNESSETNSNTEASQGNQTVEVNVHKIQGNKNDRVVIDP